jgi:hypothetical protein
MLGNRRIICTLVAAVALLGAGSARAAVGPGAVLLTPVGQCTMNFLFDGSDGARYIASAGHCVLDSGALGGGNAGEKTWAPGAGPVAQDENGQRIGTFSYAILQDPKDFSLIRLDPSVAATPQMPTFGGPVGTFNDASSTTRVLQYYGQGVIAGQVLPARQAIAFGTSDPDHIFAWGLVTPGDSGAAIETSDGLAAGVVVTLGLNLGSIGTNGVDAGLAGITRLAPQVTQAEKVLGIHLTLRTAPLLSGGSGAVVPATTGSGPTTEVPAATPGVPASAPSSKPIAVPKAHPKHKKKAKKKAKKAKRSTKQHHASHKH